MARLLRGLFIIQGLYYAAFGAWGILSVQSFSDFTGYGGDFFLKQINAALFLALGLWYIHPADSKFKALTAAVAAFLIALVDFWYLNQIGGSLLKYDMAEELAFAILISAAEFAKK